MKLEINNSKSFSYELSAFLSSARSVLIYGLEEVKLKSGGQQWYDNQISTSKILNFFRDKRNINIHEQPITLKKQVNLTVTDYIQISDSVTVEKKREWYKKDYERY
jgi:hypothetical protein